MIERKKQYERPEIEAIELKTEAFIATSGEPEENSLYDFGEAIEM